MSAARVCMAGFKLRMTVAFVLAALASQGCVYFNLYYNTIRIFEEAERVPRAKDGKLTSQASGKYELVIEKCEMLITKHPDSKYVDDAVLLMGKCYFRQEKSSEAITKFRELAANFPKSDLNEEGQFYMAKAYLQKGDPVLAVPILQALIEENPKNDDADEMLYLLGTSLIEMGREEEAVQYLERLREKYSRSDYRVQAELEVASLYIDLGEPEKSLAIYSELGKVRLSEENRIRYLIERSEAQVRLRRYLAAQVSFDQLHRYNVGTQDQARIMLLEGETWAGIDSTNKAIDTYKSVVARFPKSKFSAEAYFKLGVVYQTKLDSLTTAKTNYENVPRQYANSEFAQIAIQRSISISKLQKLRHSISRGEEANRATAQFDLAEVEFFQFKNYKRALVAYKRIVRDYPNDELAPRAAYAIGYIYDEYMDDKQEALKAYRRVVREYPDSQQAEFAREQLRQLTALTNP
ncbi:MAG: tetratricopeptide repeat protein [bacterium]|nr:tetratricopeptide repeat protein [bacterium]